MGDASAISWTTRTWNPTVGCTKVSAGCDHCYAETFVNRFAGSKGFPERFDTMVLRDDSFMLKPLSPKWRREPSMVFVNSLSDVFHKDVPDDSIARIFAVMALADGQTFQLLTKRHGRMRSLLSSPAFEQMVWRASNAILDSRIEIPREDFNSVWPLPNVWLGVSVEDQGAANMRIPALLDTPAAVRWLSMEPLIGEVSIRRALNGDPTGWRGVGALDWIVVGGESGHGARPMRPEWVDSIRAECRDGAVPFHFKQLGAVLAKEWGMRGKGDDPEAWSGMDWPREYPKAVAS